ncbi:MAG: sulfite exporter TauE/SafE family protein, partial [Anaerolineae bacterium]
MVMTGVFTWQALFVLGLTGSLGHCLGMCGPLVLLVGTRPAAQGARLSLVEQLLYHGTRILVYGCLGLIIGALGRLLGQGPSLSRTAGIVSIFLGIAIIALGATYLGWLRLGSASGASWWSRLMNRVLDWPGSGGIIALGALNGVLPCGLVYSALTTSMSAGSALLGGLAMLAFGLGTVPVMLTLGFTGHLIPSPTRRIL